MAASFHVLVLVMALALSSLFVAHVEGVNEKQTGSVSIENQLIVPLTVDCYSGSQIPDAFTILSGAYGSFEFPIEAQNFWKCHLSAPATTTGWPHMTGTFTLWTRSPSFVPSHDVFWLVNGDGLYIVPTKRKGITPLDGTLIFRWQHVG